MFCSCRSTTKELFDNLMATPLLQPHFLGPKDSLYAGDEKKIYIFWFVADMLTEENEKFVEFGIGGLCNCSLGKLWREHTLCAPAFFFLLAIANFTAVYRPVKIPSLCDSSIITKHPPKKLQIFHFFMITEAQKVNIFSINSFHVWWQWVNDGGWNNDRGLPDMFCLPCFAHAYKITLMMKICTWNKLTEKIPTFWSITHHKDAKDLPVSFWITVLYYGQVITGKTCFKSMGLPLQ